MKELLHSFYTQEQPEFCNAIIFCFMIKTILFDLDGTLLNTLTDLANCVNYALNANQLPQRTTAEIRAFLGNGIRNLIEKSVPQDTSTALTDKVFQAFKAYYLEHSLDFTAPYEGIRELLAILKERGVKMGIISNKVDAAVQQLNRQFFDTYMDIAIGEREGVRRKPAPDSLLFAMEALNATAETTLYVGDSEVDYETAKAAHLRCALVTWGFRDESELRTLNADYYINKAEELLELV